MPDTLSPPNTLLEPRSKWAEAVNDPKVNLAELLQTAGLEGLSPDARLSLIEHASLEDYLGAVDVLHRKVASEYSHEPHPTAVELKDTRTGTVSGMAAKPEERAKVMGYALDAAKAVVQKYHQEGGLIDDALQRCGNLLAFGTVLAHTYENGNGRTARTLGELIHNGYDDSNPESVTNLATVSAGRPERPGYKINSYVPFPTGPWADGRANQEPLAFLDAVAALDQPLDGHSYAAATRGSFTTPRMA